ncbi:MAG: hypothetical protein P3X22_001475 [Thermoprotei archaeon]|nr:hypothetical protein [Thermoprotei archaeon]
MKLEVKPALILAEGECLAVSAALDWDGVEVPERVLEAVGEAFTKPGGGRLESLETREAIIAYTIIYGGLILSYKCNPVTPISRVHVKTRLKISGEGEPVSLEDKTILKAWAKIFKGEEIEGLEEIKGTTTYPAKLKWRPEREGVKVAPIAVKAIT